MWVRIPSGVQIIKFKIMLNIQTKQVISESDWSDFVSKHYGRPYQYQQQDGCQERGNFYLNVPSEDDNSEMNDEIPETLETNEMGVKFEKWLERDPLSPVGDETQDWIIAMWWERNFYPDIQIVANDLYEKGLLEAGKYIIEIDW